MARTKKTPVVKHSFDTIYPLIIRRADGVRVYRFTGLGRRSWLALVADNEDVISQRSLAPLRLLKGGLR